MSKADAREYNSKYWWFVLVPYCSDMKRKYYKTYGRAYNAACKLIEEGYMCQINGYNENGEQGIIYC